MLSCAVVATRRALPARALSSQAPPQVDSDGWRQLYSAAWNNSSFLLVQKFIAFQGLVLGPTSTGLLVHSGSVHEAVAALFSAMPLAVWALVSRLQRSYPVAVSLSPDQRQVGLTIATPFGGTKRLLHSVEDIEPSPRNPNDAFVFLTAVADGQTHRYSIQKDGIQDRLIFERLSDGFLNSQTTQSETK